MAKEFLYIDSIDKTPKIRGGFGGGGSSGGGEEAPNDLFSSDIGFVLYALGEGPIYKINPNGPQDAEINESSVQTLLTGLTSARENVNSDIFYYIYNTGTLTQTPLKNFGDKTVVPQSLSSPIQPQYASDTFDPLVRDTSVGPHTALEFRFVINGLYSQAPNSGNINPRSAKVRVKIFDSTGATLITQKETTFNNKTTISFTFTVKINIPEAHISENGYKFTVEGSKSTKNTEVTNIVFVGWAEIIDEQRAYPRTATIGYAIKANDEIKGAVPTTTSMVKGMIVKVPSNYNQPLLRSQDSWDGSLQIDWRNLEVPDVNTTINYEGSNLVVNREIQGFTLQNDQNSLLFSQDPVIYKGDWDGSFVYSWTQNPVWITYDLLTNTQHGLGIPEDAIDKYKFYRVAKYCDACNENGVFEGVHALADGGYRYKPTGLYIKPRQRLIGLPTGTPVKERRFIMDVSITEQTQIYDLINKITATFRSILVYNGGLITLNIDMPDDYPVAAFNETNILYDSVAISGIEESSLITGVELGYLEPTNHYKRELLKIDDPKMLSELNGIENVLNLDLIGVTRRSQAVRYANYLIAANKYLRRKVGFETDSSAQNLTPGDIITVQQKIIGTQWAYGGRIYQDSVDGSGSVYLEHFSAPAITDDLFTASSNLALRVNHISNDTSNLFLVSLDSNDRQILETGTNTSSGYERFSLTITREFNFLSKNWVEHPLAYGEFKAARGDSWALGPIELTTYDNNPESFYRTNDKLFKILTIDRNEDEKVRIEALEYVPNVYIDSDTVISYEPINYIELNTPLNAPPSPNFDLKAVPIVNSDGSLRVDLQINDSVNPDGFEYKKTIRYSYAKPDAETRITQFISGDYQ